MYLPPGEYNIVLHATTNLSSTAAIIYSGDVHVLSAERLASGNDTAAVCDILTMANMTGVEPLTSLSMLASLISTWKAGTELQSIMQSDFSALNCSALASELPVADYLLGALQAQVTAVSGDSAPIAINAVNSVATALLTLLPFLSSASPATVNSTLNVTAQLTATLAGEAIGYQGGNQSVYAIYNEGFDSLAATYSALLTLSSNLHCQLMEIIGQRMAALLTLAMTGHQSGDVDVAFTPATFSASATRLSPTLSPSGASVDSNLSLALPGAMWSGVSASVVDVQRLVWTESLSGWSGCYPMTVTTAAGANATTLAALVPAPLVSLTLVGQDGVELPVSSLTTPLAFTLPYNHSAARTATPICAFLNRSTDLWSTAGCSSSATDDGVRCSCCHLTEFTVVGLTYLTTANGDGQANKATAANSHRADVLGIFILYLIPFIVSLVLLLVLLCTHRSILPWSRSTYVTTAITSLARCVGTGLLYFGDYDAATATFQLNVLAEVMTALLVMPPMLELLQLLHTVYRYSVVRAKESNQPQPQPRASVSKASVDLTPTARPISPVLSALLAGVYLVATLPAVAVFVNAALTSADATSTVVAIVILTLLAALVVVCLWMGLVGSTLPQMTPALRQGQTVVWLPVLAFTLQSVLIVAFCATASPSWYFRESAGGLHVYLILYALLEVTTLTGSACAWGWLVHWWRPWAATVAQRRKSLVYTEVEESAMQKKEESLWRDSVVSRAPVSKRGSVTRIHPVSHRSSVISSTGFINDPTPVLDDGGKGGKTLHPKTAQGAGMVPELIKQWEEIGAGQAGAGRKYSILDGSTYRYSERSEQSSRLSTYRSTNADSAVPTPTIPSRLNSPGGSTRPQPAAAVSSPVNISGDTPMVVAPGGPVPSPIALMADTPSLLPSPAVLGSPEMHNLSPAAFPSLPQSFAGYFLSPRRGSTVAPAPTALAVSPLLSPVFHAPVELKPLDRATAPRPVPPPSRPTVDYSPSESPLDSPESTSLYSMGLPQPTSFALGPPAEQPASPVPASPVTALSILISSSPITQSRTLSAIPPPPPVLPNVTRVQSQPTPASPRPLVHPIRIPQSVFDSLSSETMAHGEVRRAMKARVSRSSLPDSHLSPRSPSPVLLTKPAEEEKEEVKEEEEKTEADYPSPHFIPQPSETSPRSRLSAQRHSVYVIHRGKPQVSREMRRSVDLSGHTLSPGTASPQTYALPIAVRPRADSRVTREGSLSSTPYPTSPSPVSPGLSPALVGSGGPAKMATGGVLVRKRITRANSVSPSPAAPPATASIIPALDLGPAPVSPALPPAMDLHPKSRKPRPSPPALVLRGLGERSQSTVVAGHRPSQDFGRGAHVRRESLLATAGVESLSAVGVGVVEGVASEASSPVMRPGEGGLRRSMTSVGEAAISGFAGFRRDNFMAGEQAED